VDVSAQRRPSPARRGGTRVERAYAELKRRILDDEYAAGYQATEPEIAVALGMSRTPVREALIRLEREGLVEVVPRRGMRVVPLSAADMRDIYQVLTCLETEAAGLLARRHPSPEELQPLRKAIADMDAALHAERLDAWADADERFHRALLELCGNRRLAALAFTVWDQVHRARLVTLRLRPRPWRSNADHRALLAALGRGDEKRARAVHHRHRLRAAKMLTHVLEKHALSRL
jgi:DNA-binding GntR family transcriptional regulator